MIGIVIDIVLVAILGLNIFLGYKKGLIKVIFSICAFLIALIITLILFKPISNIVKENTNLDENIKQMIIENNKKELNSKENISTDNKIGFEEYFNKYIKDASEDVKNKAIDVFASNVSECIVNIIVGLSIFAITRIILIFLKFVVESISELPIIKQFNEAGGIIYGLIKGMIIIYIILTILFFVISINANGLIAEAINDSYITKFLYENNIIVTKILNNL